MNVAFLTEGMTIGVTVRSLFDKADLAIWRGDYRDGRRLLDRVSTTKPLPRALRAILVGDICHFEWNGREAARQYREAIKACHGNQLDSLEIFAIYRLVDTAIDYQLEHGKDIGGTEDYTAMFDAAYTRASKLRNKFLIAFGLHYRGLFAIVDGDYVAARSHLQEAAKLRRDIGDTWHLWNTEWLLARCNAGMGMIAEARAEAERIYKLQIGAGLKGAALRVLLGLTHLATMENLARVADAKEGVTTMSPDSLSAFMSAVDGSIAEYEAPVALGFTMGAGSLHS